MEKDYLEKSWTPALKKDLEECDSPEPRTADEAAKLYQITIRDTATMIENVYVSNLREGWLIVESYKKMTIYLPHKKLDSLEGKITFDVVRYLLEEYNKALQVNWKVYDSTMMAFYRYLLEFSGEAEDLPRWIDVEPLRWDMIEKGHIEGKMRAKFKMFKSREDEGSDSFEEDVAKLPEKKSAFW